MLNVATLSTNSETDTYVLHRRFDRMGRLVGDTNMQRLFDAHVMIIGLGGVGSWAAESLARSGVGRLTLIDFDEICVTNTNRQLHALSGLIGKKKALVLAERMQKINPNAKIEGVPVFYNAETSEDLLARKPDFIFDAIDNITAKCHLLATARARGLKIVAAGGSGGRMDPLQIQQVDLAETHTDPMLYQVRKILRAQYDFPSEGPFGIPTVFSKELHQQPVELHYDKGQGFRCVCPQGSNEYHSCEKRHVIYGTASFVTGAFGLTAASHIVRKIVE
jgi:tRNA threonylcarbamoyladenosine dehydratase